VNPDDRVPVTLTAAQWNVVLAMLAAQPYRDSAPLISSIQTQCNQYTGYGGDAGKSPAEWHVGNQGKISREPPP
jgi:hypothetical protein